MIPARGPAAWLVAAVAGSLVSGLVGPPLAGQATAVLLEDCSTVDSVFATRVLRIAEVVPRMGTFALDGRGRLFGWAPQRARGVVWDPEGARIGTLGGPVYHESSTIPAAIVVGHGDTIHVFERSELTHARFSPELEFLGSTPLPGQPHFNGVVRLPGGEWVMSAIIDTPDRAGWPIHLLDDEGGIVRSFGTSLPFYRADATRLSVRSVAVAGDSLVWAAHVTEYRLELWDTHNRLHKAFVRDLPWFPRWIRNKPISREEPLNPMLGSIRLDADGLLWVEVSRASEQFAEVVEWSDEWEMYYPASTSEYQETFFEVIDVEAGCIAARGTTGALLVNAVGDGFYAGYEDWVTDGVYRSEVELWRLGIAGR